MASWQASPPSSRQQSASEQLQCYIDRFVRSQAPTPTPIVPDSRLSAPQRATRSDDTDAWDLLCGRGGYGGGHVSVKTRCILQDVDRKLGYTEPRYSAQETLDLRSLWPSMHEHLERRWRQQLRERYEAQQRAEAAAAATAAEAASRSDLYRYSSSRTFAGTGRRIRLPPKPEAVLTAPVRVFADSENNDDEAAGSSDSESGGSSLAAGAAAAVRSSEDGRCWGSDSGIGQSCVGAAVPTVPARAATAAPDAAGNHNGAANDDAEVNSSEGDDSGSFEERMRSYRCVLEAHELSSRLRQHLEAACATVSGGGGGGGGGKRVLSVEDKGRIRDRLARLQGPLRSGFDLTDNDGQQLDKQQHQQGQGAERITTERLSRLMNSARSLLLTRVEDAEEVQRRRPESGPERLSDEAATAEAVDANL